MVNYYIYAKDFSTSTEGVKYYHQNGLKTVEQFKKDVEEIEKELLYSREPFRESKIIYLHWGLNCEEVDEDLIISTYSNKNASEMGTEPECIIHWLKNNYNICSEDDTIKLLYIITDGLTDRYSAEKCFKLNENMHYERLVFHAFNLHLKAIDLSVAASFFKSQCTVYRNNQLHDKINVAEAYDYDKINLDNYETEYKELKSYIKLKFIKNFGHDSVALKEIDKLKKLRGRLFNELRSKEEKNVVNLETKDKNIFLQEFVKTNWYKNLFVTAYEIKVEIEKTISTLINYIVSDAKSYSFDALKFVKVYDKPVVEQPVVNVNFTPEQEIEFPDVIMDDDKGIPVILLAEFNLMNKIIFHNNTNQDQVPPASFNKFKSAMECPLFLVNDPDISASIGYFYTLNVFKQLLESHNMTDPRTRRPFRGGLVLTDTDLFDKYNDYILSATYFGCKKVDRYYNVGLFYFVLWKNSENKEWMDRNVVDQFKKYTMRRISETVCKIGLSSLPLDPQENTSLLTALWYCVELSSCIFKSDPLLYKHERLRGYSGVAHHMIEILKYFDYDLDLEAIEKRKELISNVMILKRIHKRKDRVFFYLNQIFKTLNGFLVSEIEKPSHLYKLNYLKFNHKEMFRDDVLKEEVHLNDYVHLMHVVEDTESAGTFEMCEKTFRPFFTIDQSKSFYTDLLRITRKVVVHNDKDKINITYEEIDSLEFDRILSLYKLFIDCVIDIEKYPRFSDYVEYISRKKKFHENLVTIFPSNIYCCAKIVYERYQKLVAKVDISDFIKVSMSYVNRVERIKGEGRLKFSCHNDINNYLSNEEVKVKLIKKTQNAST